MKWEYCAIRQYTSLYFFTAQRSVWSDPLPNAPLDDKQALPIAWLGEQGWEAFASTSEAVMWFKRPKRS